MRLPSKTVGSRFWRLAWMSCVAGVLAACGGGGSGESPQAFDSQALFDPVPSSSGADPIVPFPFDGLFSGFHDPTLEIPNDDDIPFVSAANELDGFSLTADAFFDIAGRLDYATLPGALHIIDTGRGVPLVWGVDFTARNSPATARDPLTGVETPIETQRSRVLIQWLRPLRPSTTYAVALLSAAATQEGAHIAPSPEFRIVSSDIPVAEQREPVLDVLDDAQKARLESLRSTLIRPLVVELESLGIDPGELALAYPFTTQSSGLSLAAIASTVTAAPLLVASTGITTDQALHHPAAAGATIHAGTLRVPYYLGNSGGDPHSIAPITSYWLADPTKPNLDAADPTHLPAFLGQVPCAAFAAGVPLNGQTAAPSRSTTLCFPVPIRQSFETLPVLVTVPNGDSGRTRPASGWPVVVLQHGITGNRTHALAIAGDLARAGLVTIAIDLPLHGITDPASPFYRNQLFVGSAAASLITGERTFDLDLQDNSTQVAGPDGVNDGSGVWFVNLQSLLTSRDNLRQAVADLLTLVKSLPGLDVDTDGTPDIDGSRITFAGLSLGGIVGVPLLANTTDVGAASLVVPGGGIGKLLDASKTFGPEIAAGLATQGILQGSDDYETFIRFAQTVIDDGDPLPYAQAASLRHPLHLIEVVGGGTDADAGFEYPADTVVPNGAPANDGSSLAYDRVTISGPLAGTDPLIVSLGLQDLGAIDVPVAPSRLVTDAAGVRAAVRFRQGTHVSILDPTGGLAPMGLPSGTSTSLAATIEMRRQTANFLASGGACLPIARDCPMALAGDDR